MPAPDRLLPEPGAGADLLPSEKDARVKLAHDESGKHTIMSTNPEDAAKSVPEASKGALSSDMLSAEAVDAYLRRHPQFLNDHPDLIPLLVPPEFDHGAGVIDLQQFMLQRLKGEMARLRTRERALLAAAEANVSTQGRVHHAVKALLAATSFQHLIRIVVDEFPAMLDVTASSIGVENGERLPGTAGDTGVVVLKPGAIDALVGTDRAIVLRPATEDDRAVFDARMTRVHSVAMMRLGFGPHAPAGLFALGAASTDGFDARQGTDLLGFLAHVLQLRIRRWLSLGG
jgi:uncharacterized protein YigA (DUF484 family)